jgi:hypothetical protein
MKVFSFCLYGK